MNRRSPRQALVHATTLIALVALARLLPSPLSRGAALVAATLQIYWPLAAFEAGEEQAVFRRAYFNDLGAEATTALLVLFATLPPWAFAAHWYFGRAWPSADCFTFHAGSFGTGLELVLLATQEEWFWRGYVQPSIGNHARGILATSGLFGLCHWAFLGTPLGLATAIPSIVFGALQNRRGRLLACTLVHIGYNTASRLLFAIT